MKCNYKGLTVFLATLIIGLQVSTVSARELAGVEIEEQATISGVEKPLLLNGAAIRYKFFFKIYIGALYLPEKTREAKTILQGNQANRVLMHFIYDEVPAKKLVDAWHQGFSDNVTGQQLDILKPRLEEFNSLFGDLYKGNVVLLDYVPGEGTRVNIRGKQVGLIAGADFNRALLSVWLGEEPVTEELKQGMLGSEADE